MRLTGYFEHEELVEVVLHVNPSVGRRPHAPCVIGEPPFPVGNCVARQRTEGTLELRNLVESVVYTDDSQSSGSNDMFDLGADECAPADVLAR